MDSEDNNELDDTGLEQLVLSMDKIMIVKVKIQRTKIHEITEDID